MIVTKWLYIFSNSGNQSQLCYGKESGYNRHGLVPDRGLWELSFAGRRVFTRIKQIHKGLPWVRLPYTIQALKRTKLSCKNNKR
jgi:hypothetical protein